MKHLFAASVLTVSALAPQTVFCAETAAEEKAEEKGNFNALTVDVLAAAGLSSELYLHVEPALEIGVVSIGKTMGVGVGAGVDLGWCALCGLVSAISDLNWKGSFIAPFARSTLHLGSLGGLVPTKTDKYTVDPYVGLLVGPSFYKFTLSTDDGASTLEVKRTAIRIAPVLGARLGFAGGHLLLFGEYRFGIEAGFTAVKYTGADGSEIIIPQDDINRRGNDFVVGIGARF